MAEEVRYLFKSYWLFGVLQATGHIPLHPLWFQEYRSASGIAPYEPEPATGEKAMNTVEGWAPGVDGPTTPGAMLQDSGCAPAGD